MKALPSALIFDLDQTLVDSRVALDARNARRWQQVYSLIPKFAIYEGVSELLGSIEEMRLPVVIVTSSPNSYATRVIRHFQIRVQHLVCYHDTRLHKPHPAPIALAIERLGISPDDVWSIGDEAKDMAASKAAGAVAGGALWGASDPASLAAAAPDFLDRDPGDLASRLAATR